MGENYAPSEEIYNYVCDQYYKYLLMSRRAAAEKKLNVLILHAIDMLIEHNIIFEKIIPTHGVRYKTYKYFKIEVEDYSAINNFNFSFIEYQ